MNREIKMLLQRIERTYQNYYVQDILSNEELKLLADCILNLQTKIDKAREYIEKHSNSFSVLDTISNAKLLEILDKEKV